MVNSRITTDAKWSLLLLLLLLHMTETRREILYLIVGTAILFDMIVVNHH